MVYGQFQSVPQEEFNSCHSNCDKEIFCHLLYEEDIRNHDKNYTSLYSKADDMVESKSENGLLFTLK